MASESRCLRSLPDQKSRSVFDLPSDFFDFSRLFSDGAKEMPDTHFPFPSKPSEISPNGEDDKIIQEDKEEKERGKKVISRLSCNTCKAEFDSLQDQRSHFKSDIHRFNVKLSVAGKDTIKEQDFDKLTSDSLSKDYDISSISGSEDEVEESCSNPGILGKGGGRAKLKLFIRLQGGDIVSIWKCLLLNEFEEISFEKNKSSPMENDGHTVFLSENELVERLKYLIHEPRDETCLRIVLLASGGHFAGCVFDGKSVVAQKTFHRYVVRAKAGNRQMTKDATGKAAKSAGASLRRYNEVALKKEIQELLVAWKPYFDASSCIFIYAPSINRQLLFDGEKPSFSRQNCAVRHVTLTVRRPTLKEAKRVYNQLTFMTYEIDEKGCLPSVTEDSLLLASNVERSNQESKEEELSNPLENKESPSEACSDLATSGGLSVSSKSEVIATACTELCSIELTPLHEAARSGDTHLTLELLEQGLDPCVKDARGRTPYMLATEKEVRSTFRRFMALNLDKWDWHAANVPSPLTKEMEDSQAAKQAEKDAKRKAKSKELKKLRKAKEKAQARAQAPAPLPQNASVVSQNQKAVPVSIVKGNLNSDTGAQMSKEEELKRAQAAEREKRAAAAERRIAALKGLGTSTTIAPSSSEPNSGGSDINCSCCKASLAGKVPFHRYHYRYCSTSCMHVHREMLEDG